MTAVESGRLARNPFERLFDALTDPRRCERTMATLLGAYAAAWSLYAAISHASQDTHFDMGEMFAWSHEIGLSAPTHPPLGAWLVRGWFAFMPVEPWAYYMLGVVLATVALWIAWRVLARYVDAEKRVVGVVLLTFVPFYNFHAFKFNAQVVQVPFWAATTWWFLRSFETRRPGSAVLAGIGAGLAMLGKYWSMFLLAGLAFAALTDPRRRDYFRSAAPWLTITSGVLVLAPHVAFIATHDFTTFGFALTSHKVSLGIAAESTFGFLGGILGYIATPIVLGMLATRPSAAANADTLWPAKAERRFPLVAFAVPIILPTIVAVPLRDQLVSLWMMPAMTLLPVVLLSSPLITVKREAAVRLLAFAIGFPLVMVAVSPAVAVVIHREGLADYQADYRLIAHAVMRAWQARTDAPLRIVGSYRNVVDGTNFYFPSRPKTFAMEDPARTPWVHESDIKRDGIAIVCPEPVTVCVQKMHAYAARYGAKIKEVTLARWFFGTSDPPVRYDIAIIPPQQ